MDTPHQGLTGPQYTALLAKGFEHGLKITGLAHTG
jgi:hypothetical protein